MPDLIAYVDGGSHGSPGPSGIGVVIEQSGAEKVRIAKAIGRQDNNVAEYVALLEALQHAVAVKARTLHVYSDSQIVVRQMTGQYACHSPRLYYRSHQPRPESRSQRTGQPCRPPPQDDIAPTTGILQTKSASIVLQEAASL
jgi:ribonuclease HI